MAGVVLLPDLGKLQVLDVGKLFGLTPEASISRSAQAATLARSDAELSDATVSLPAIARTGGQNDPLLAVLVQAPGGTAPPIGIAIRSLCDWLPAHSVRRSGMRMGAMGEFGLINAKGALDHANLVVVDLAQMAYLLG